VGGREGNTVSCEALDRDAWAVIRAGCRSQDRLSERSVRA